MVAIALTWAAGFVDGFAYLVLGHIYVATMSGNTVLVGLHAVDGDGQALLRHALALGTFVAGLILSGLVIRLLMRAGLRHVLAIAMMLEAICLVAVLVVGTGFASRVTIGIDGERIYVLASLAAVAMGIQNTSLRMAKVLTVYTTHVTGALTKFSEDAIDWLLPALHGAARDRARPVAAADVLLSFGLWLGFLVGALASAYAVGRVGTIALVLPIGVVAAVAIADCVAPLSRTEA